MALTNRTVGFHLTLLLIAALTVCTSPRAMASELQQPIPDTTSPNAVSPPTGSILISADGQWKFAEQYFHNAQWPPAISEYRRFLHFFPRDPRVPSAYYQIGLAQLNQGSPEEAKIHFERVLTLAQTPTELTFRALFKIGDCLARTHSSQQAVDHLSRVSEMTDDPTIKAEALYRSGWLLLDNLQIGQARPYFERIAPDQRPRFNIDSLITELAAPLPLSRKDPGLAGSLALLPGAGYLYLERYQDAWISLLAVGALGWATYEAFENDSPVLGSLLGLTGSGFYLGSIRGSIASAHKANQHRTRRFIDHLRQSYNVQLSLNPGQSGMGLSLSVDF